MRSYATYQNGGSYSTPWKWDSSSSTFEIQQKPTASEIYSHTQYTRPIRPGNTYRVMPLTPAAAPTKAAWATESHSVCHITFTPLSGEYRAAHVIDIDYSLGKEISSLIGGWAELSISLAFSWGSKESAPKDGTLQFTVDVASVLSNAATLGVHGHYRDNVYNVVYRVTGLLVSAKTIALSLRYDCIWVSGESQTLFGEYVSSIVAAVSVPFIEVAEIVQSSSAARLMAAESWEIV